MRFILEIIIYALCIMMFFVRREQKVSLLLIYAICLSSVNVNYSLLINPVVFYIFSEFRHLRQYVQAPRKYDLRIFVGTIFVGCVLLILNSPHLRSIGEIFVYIKVALLYKYLLLFIPLVVMREKRNMKSYITPIFLSLLILTIFGLLNFFTQRAVFVDWTLEGQDLNKLTEDAGSAFSDKERFRVQAMHFNPFNYGFICLALMMFFHYLKKEKMVNSSLFVIAMFCCLFGIISCGCRTILMCAALGFFCLYALTHELRRTIGVVALSLMVLIIGYFYVPYVTEKLDFITSVFDSHSDVSGSSITMRAYQLMAVLARISGHLYLGMGYNYFSIDLGWKDGPEGLIDEDLYGLEGVYLNLLLERGVVGLFLYLFFMFLLIRNFYSYRKIDVNCSSFCLSLCVIYLTFAFMTGELNSVFITFLLLGIGMKYYFLKNIVTENM